MHLNVVTVVRISTFETFVRLAFSVEDLPKRLLVTADGPMMRSNRELILDQTGDSAGGGAVFNRTGLSWLFPKKY